MSSLSVSGPAPLMTKVNIGLYSRENGNGRLVRVSGANEQDKA
jgi:hypothetical protein